MKTKFLLMQGVFSLTKAHHLIDFHIFGEKNRDSGNETAVLLAKIAFWISFKLIIFRDF